MVARLRQWCQMCFILFLLFPLSWFYYAYYFLSSAFNVNIILHVIKVLLLQCGTAEFAVQCGFCMCRINRTVRKPWPHIRDTAFSHAWIYAIPLQSMPIYGKALQVLITADSDATPVFRQLKVDLSWHYGITKNLFFLLNHKNNDLFKLFWVFCFQFLKYRKDLVWASNNKMTRTKLLCRQVNPNRLNPERQKLLECLQISHLNDHDSFSIRQYYR